MAKGTKTTNRVPTTTYRDVNAYELILSQDEAQALADILSKVGGNPDTSRRKFANAIFVALRHVGVEYGGGVHDRAPDLERNLLFGDGPDSPYHP